MLIHKHVFKPLDKIAFIKYDDLLTHPSQYQAAGSRKEWAEIQYNFS